MRNYSLKSNHLSEYIDIASSNMYDMDVPGNAQLHRAIKSANIELLISFITLVRRSTLIILQL